MSEGGQVRVVFHQPGLASYRVPIFRELAQRPGIDFTLIHNEDARVKLAPADGFRAKQTRIVIRKNGLQFDWPSFSSAKRHDLDVLCLSWNAWNLLLLPTLWRAHRRGIGTIVWGHGLGNNRVPLWRQGIRLWLGRVADVALLYSQPVADRLIAEAGFDPSRTVVAANSLDSDAAVAARQQWVGSEALASFRATHGLDTGGPVLLFVSRLQERNRTDLLLRAAARLQGSFAGLRVVVVGDGPCRGALRALGDELGLGEALVMPGAVYGEAEIAPWFCAASVFCYPAFMGLSLLHAFSYGLPVVTGNDLPGHGPEIDALRDGENGLLFKHNDLDDLVRTLGGLLRDGDRLTKMSKAAAWTVDPANPSSYCKERMVDGIVRAIEIAQERSRKRRVRR